jgi:hypothetical protein
MVGKFQGLVASSTPLMVVVVWMTRTSVSSNSKVKKTGGRSPNQPKEGLCDILFPVVLGRNREHCSCSLYPIPFFSHLANWNNYRIRHGVGSIIKVFLIHIDNAGPLAIPVDLSDMGCPIRSTTDISLEDYYYSQ